MRVLTSHIAVIDEALQNGPTRVLALQRTCAQAVLNERVSWIVKVSLINDRPRVGVVCHGGQSRQTLVTGQTGWFGVLHGHQLKGVNSLSCSRSFQKRAAAQLGRFMKVSRRTGKAHLCRDIGRVGVEWT